MKRSVAYLAVILILVVLIAVLSITIFNRAPASPAETEKPQEIHTLPPQQTGTLPPTTPEPTEMPTPTPEPTEEPVFETREPVETPEPVNIDASGSFSSSTGTYLNLVVDWRTFRDTDGTPKLQIDLSASSYSFHTSALYDGLELTVGGETYRANSPEVHYDGDSLAITPLYSFVMDAPEGSTAVTATWHYKGSYSGIELENIVASGTVNIG